MSIAFKCDKCGEFVEGHPANNGWLEHLSKDFSYLGGFVKFSSIFLTAAVVLPGFPTANLCRKCFLEAVEQWLEVARKGMEYK